MGNFVLYSVDDIFMYRLRNMAEYWTEIWVTMYCNSVHDIFMYRLRNMAEYWTEIWVTMY